jgi:hypothetical protein
MYPPNIVLNLKPYTFTINYTHKQLLQMIYEVPNQKVTYWLLHETPHWPCTTKRKDSPSSNYIESWQLKEVCVCVCDNTTTIFSNLNYHSWIKDTCGFISCDGVNYPSSYPSYRLGLRSLNWRFQVFLEPSLEPN